MVHSEPHQVQLTEEEWRAALAATSAARIAKLELQLAESAAREAERRAEGVLRSLAEKYELKGRLQFMSDEGVIRLLGE